MVKTSFISKKANFKVGVKHWAEIIKVHPAQIRVQKMTNKWASCSTKGWICFNTKLINKPRQLKDYVIVHELLHIKIPNHGKLFKTLLSIYVPNWKEIDESLSNG